MQSSGDKFLTLECSLYDNKLSSWSKAWSSSKFVQKRVKAGVTYAGWSTNRSCKNEINVWYKFNDEKSMESYREQVRDSSFCGYYYDERGITDVYRYFKPSIAYDLPGYDSMELQQEPC